MLLCGVRIFMNQALIRAFKFGLSFFGGSYTGFFRGFFGRFFAGFTEDFLGGFFEVFFGGLFGGFFISMDFLEDFS